MTYRIRVTLNGIKGFFRLYNVNPTNTLYSLHKQMNSDMSFPSDQLILFKGLDENSNVVGRYGLFDLGSGTADEMTIEKCVKAGISSFVYFYDTTNKKSVILTIEGSVEGCVSSPTLVEVKGPDPIEFENGYVAFEDLPDDKRHLPGEKKKSDSLAGLLGIDEDDLDDVDDEDEDGDEEDEDDEEEEGIEDDDVNL